MQKIEVRDRNQETERETERQRDRDRETEWETKRKRENYRETAKCQFFQTKYRRLKFIFLGNIFWIYDSLLIYSA